MGKPLRWVLRVVLAVAGLAIVVIGTFVAIVHRQLPGSDAPRLPGLSQAVEVAFDARAVPTLRAANLVDSSRALGLLHARERFFQMELQRRTARGELAEVLGKAVLPLDELHRTYGFTQIAEQAAARLPPESARHLQAYSEGVNAWLEARKGRVSLELTILGIKPRPWTPADSLAVLLLMHEDLSSSWRTEQRIDALHATEAKQRFLFPRVTDEDVLLVPDAAPQSPDSAKIFHGEHAKLDLPKPIEIIPGEGGVRDETIGSNNWVIGGSRTRSGKPILANDPHLALRLPNLWYAARIEWAGRFVQGVTLPGLPGVVIGHNDRVAWGFTNIGTDVQDLYREPATSERHEVIAIKGERAQVLNVKTGAHGPQVMEGLSLHWTALDPGYIGGALTNTMEARDWASFNAAFDGFVGAAQNVVYADADGHIGWRATGRVPKRVDGDDGSAPLPATGHDWQGFVPQSEMPRIFDPPSGRIVTANQRVIGTSFPHPVTASWANPSRARRIVELIDSAKEKITAADVMRMQLDVVSPLHSDLAKLLHGQLTGELAKLLDGFDGSARADDNRMLASEQLLNALRIELRTAALGQPYKELSWSNDVAAVEEALREPQEAWTRAGLGDKAALIRRAQAAAELALRELPAKTWGAFNETKIHHPFGLGGGFLGWLFDPPQAEQSGCGNCVRVGRPNHGQSMRMVVDFADLDATTLVLPLGQSGHLGTAHRLDQRDDWLQGDTAGRTRLHQAQVGELLVLRP
jgi:penicillin amidase